MEFREIQLETFSLPLLLPKVGNKFDAFVAVAVFAFVWIVTVPLPLEEILLLLLLLFLLLVGENVGLLVSSFVVVLAGTAKAVSICASVSFIVS